ncbi:MAG: hypothetical protein AB7H53_19235 [Hyphomicrobium sp.]
MHDGDQPADDAPGPEDSSAQAPDTSPVAGSIADLARFANAVAEWHHRPGFQPSQAELAEPLLLDIIRLLASEYADTERLDKVSYYRLQLYRYARISQFAAAQARRVTIQGVRDKAISRKAASEILGVHQATVARWLKEADAAQSVDWIVKNYPALGVDNVGKFIADERIDPDVD